MLCHRSIAQGHYSTLDLFNAVNVIPDKPNYTTPKVIKPDSSDVLEATHFLASLGGPKHAHQVSAVLRNIAPA